LSREPDAKFENSYSQMTGQRRQCGKLAASDQVPTQGSVIVSPRQKILPQHKSRLVVFSKIFLSRE